MITANRIVLVASMIVATLVGTAQNSVFAQGTASAVSVKIGYFNAGLVKASYPEAAGAEALRTQAEAQLRHDLDEANKQIQLMQEQKKPAEDIQKAIKDNQIAMSAKQQALAQLLQSQMTMAREKIQQAVTQVASDRGLDIVIDGEGLYVGGRSVLDHGVDVTQDVVKKLMPQQAKTAQNK